MRKLVWMASALALLALTACGDKGSSTGPAAAGGDAPPPPAVSATPPPEPRPETETAARSGAYGMPTAPVPYDQMTAYEQQAVANAAAARPNGEAGVPADAPTPTKTKSDNVFY